MAQWSLISLGGQHPGGSPDQRIYSGLEVPISLVIQSVHSPSLSLSASLIQFIFLNTDYLSWFDYLFIVTCLIYIGLTSSQTLTCFYHSWFCFEFALNLLQSQYFLLKMGLPIFSNFGGHLALWACDTISYPLWWGGRGNNPQRCSHDRLQFSTVIVSLLGVSAAGRTCYGRANIQWLLINVGSPYSTRTKGKQICPPLCLLTWSNIVSKIRAKKKKKKTSFQLKLKFQLKFRFKNNPSGLVKHLKKQWLYLDTHKHVVSICYA